MSIELLLALVTAVSVVVGGFWAALTVAVRQFEKRLDERFDAQEELRKEGRKLYEGRLDTVEKDRRELHSQFLLHLTALPRDYMRREDHIRFETVISAKLDALGAKQDLLAERMKKGG